MNDKVTELVEWVAKKLNSTNLMRVPWDLLDKDKKKSLLARAREILGHKDKDGNYDLVLIDREAIAHGYAYQGNDNWKPVIPLAEELKDRK